MAATASLNKKEVSFLPLAALLLDAISTGSDVDVGSDAGATSTASPTVGDCVVLGPGDGDLESPNAGCSRSLRYSVGASESWSLSQK